MRFPLPRRRGEKGDASHRADSGLTEPTRRARRN